MQVKLFIVACLVLATAAQGQPNSMVLAPGEVLVQVTATGEDKRPADDIMVQVQVSASGATAAEARAADQAKIDRLIASFAATGIDRNAMTVVPPGAAGLGFIGNDADYEASAVVVPGQLGQPAKMPPRRFANATLQVKLTSYAQVKMLQPILDAQDTTTAGVPMLALRDDGPARRAALQLAITKARGDAQAQAVSLGLHLVRLLKVTNVQTSSDLFDAAGWTVLANLQRGPSGSLVTTRAHATLDYAAAPN